ncbi:hypothetical protein ACOJBM_24845 [Rhizobium beringeri]|uniref:hypothetical protein n=1 Tax=Rhizobium beringeri TaxID=3019934 RepID=UPI003B58BD59
MRGRKAGHRCALRSPVARVASGTDSALMSVFSDIEETFPVSPAELDAIESFLGPLIQDLLNGETPAVDSEAPHISATTRRRVAEEDCHEVFVKDLV